MDIALWNQSEKLTNEDGQRIADACDLQMREDVAPAYGLQPPKVSFYRSSDKEEDLPEDCLVIIFSENLDTATQAVAGLVPADATTNTRDNRQRRFGRVYVGTILAKKGKILDGAHSVSAATSHECIEATYDPDAKLWVWSGQKLVAAEICDPVEEDAYEKQVGEHAVSVSNFVYEAWFDARAPDGSRYDHMGSLDLPFTASPGGYLIVCDADNPNPHTDPPQALESSGWKDDDKLRGFARTRVRVAW
jgi:hypothetical protein